MSIPCDIKNPCSSGPEYNLCTKALWHTPWRPERRAFRPNKYVLRGKSRGGVKNDRATTRPAAAK